MNMPVKVLFLLPYPLHRAPSQRFRIEAFFDALKQQGVLLDTNVFMGDETWKILYQEKSVLKKGWAVIQGFFRRFYAVLIQSQKYDYIFIHREASPIGPPIFEWLLAKVLRKKIIFDFDDAIRIPAITKENRLAGLIKCFWKTKYICKWSYKVSAGNKYLAAFAAEYCKNVVILPTCVDTERKFNHLQNHFVEKLVIGWTGSHSTLQYLDVVFPVLTKLEKEFEFEFLVICNKKPDQDLKSLRYIEWKEKTEVEDLSQIHIGLMPLLNDAWSEGKCGFKIIQYLSLGIPAVASPVGVNKAIIEEGKNGFLCNSEAEWYQALKTLIENTQMRADMGQKGKAKIVSEFSVQSQSYKFLALIS